jgi:hypothetical protein
VVYPTFVEFVSPNTIRKLEIFKELVDLVCHEATKISIRTTDDQVFNWVFYTSTVEKNAALKNKPAEYYSNTKEDFPLNIVLDSVGIKRWFLSYMIHCIDASILRRIINKMCYEHRKTCKSSP